MSSKFPPQHQSPPGRQSQMTPPPRTEPIIPHNCQRLEDKVAIITGGDSGIGQAVAIAFAKEGCDVAIVYLNEHDDATDTVTQIEEYNRRCLTFPGDVSNSRFCQEVVEKTTQELGRLDIVVNNAAVQYPQDNLEKISDEQLERTFKTNIFSYFYLTRSALPFLSSGSSIINTTSVTAYRGSSHLIDYSSTKGAIVSFTRSLSQSLASKNIRVNAVAPGPIWTPLIPSSFPPQKVAEFGQDVPLGRPGQPNEVAPSFVFLASQDSSYITGQVLHPNGGEIVNT